MNPCINGAGSMLRLEPALILPLRVEPSDQRSFREPQWVTIKPSLISIWITLIVFIISCFKATPKRSRANQFTMASKISSMIESWKKANGKFMCSSLAFKIAANPHFSRPCCPKTSPPQKIKSCSPLSNTTICQKRRKSYLVTTELSKSRHHFTSISPILMIAFGCVSSTHPELSSSKISIKSWL